MALGAYYATVYNRRIKPAPWAAPNGLGQLSSGAQLAMTGVVVVGGLAALIVAGQALAWFGSPPGTKFWSAK